MKATDPLPQYVWWDEWRRTLDAQTRSVADVHAGQPGRPVDDVASGGIRGDRDEPVFATGGVVSWQGDCGDCGGCGCPCLPARIARAQGGFVVRPGLFSGGLLELAASILEVAQ